MEKKNKSCRYYLCATYATCSSCNIDGKYTSCYGYNESCVSYKHMFDLSPRITDSAQKKEDLLFSSAVFFLRELSKNKNVFVEDIKKE